MGNKKIIKKKSVLDVELRGSTGSFSVGARNAGQRSLLVKYFLTHIGLDFNVGTNEDILQHLAPVREMFNLEALDFDQIMQRDIDDARVSGDLIPYLLDKKSHDIIKLFPPIIVVVLPNKPAQNVPTEKYSQVTTHIIKGVDGDYDTKLLRFGEVGSEELAFEEALQGEDVLNHDYARLKLNRHRTKLVIVDGQHRAMALLALYRNYKDGWGDEKRAPYKIYYQEWTKAYIDEYGLDSINLPVMFCTFPDLDASYDGDYTLPMAAREIFLTLNKTARKVSNTRNILLNDNDIIAHLLRRIMSHIKKSDQRAPHSMRIHNVELDQARDRQRLTSPVALTGVSHIYYAIEHVMLTQSSDVSKVSVRRGKFFKRTDLDAYGLFQRLDAIDLLGQDKADCTRRDMYRSDAADTLADKFMESYGESILAYYQYFKPFESHNKAVLDLQKLLASDGKSRLEPIFFEGQGNERVFHEHKEKLEERVKGGYFGAVVPPEINSVLSQLNDTSNDLKRYVTKLREARIDYYLGNVNDRKKLQASGEDYYDAVKAFIDKLYLNVFCSVAFQAATIATFWGEIEGCDNLPYTKTIFDEYIEQIGAVFVPGSTADFKRIVRVFRGNLEIDGDCAEIAESDSHFGKVVYRGEMQPDQWPKYRYVILEIWAPSDQALAMYVHESRDKCRSQVFLELYQSRLKQKALESGIQPGDVPENTAKEVQDESYVVYRKFLKNLNVLVADIPSLCQLMKPVDNNLVNGDDEADEEWGESPDE